MITWWKYNPAIFFRDDHDVYFDWIVEFDEFFEISLLEIQFEWSSSFLLSSQVFIYEVLLKSNTAIQLLDFW